MSAEDALKASPVEVKVLDRYLTVASVIDSDGSGTQEAVAMAMPTRLCSLRVILLLEDMGPSGDPDDDDEVRTWHDMTGACEHHMT